ncbi:hypothetical protein [Curtobacterium sp. MCBD17_040]|uniref:hypothetical protein n=1 Tax=Curtobacterium sp. MCBD17_040 TaxID=2175674 RepID=UPI000DA86F5F|nr:hypothetical protein [Curtobacterium sp. MCBD17_040]WIB65606.1 hypothetical protein DEI94_15925 [Curtobacterium sp. MCBD17_040]
MEFKTLGRDKFDRVVEALLRAEHQGDGRRAQAIDGRGGDDGIDFGVWGADGSIEHIYQLKYYPEGFSAKHSDRRRKVRESLDRAWSINHPPKWTLVIPGNPSIDEFKKTLAMRDNRPVRIEIMGQAELDVLLAKHQHVHQRFFTDHTLSYLMALNRPEEALARDGDLGKVLERVRERMLIRSDHWGVDFSVDSASGVISKTLIARTPDAHLKEPLTTELTTSFDDSTADLRDQYVHALRFGVADPVVLPRRVITSFKRRGPDWFHSDDLPAELHLLPGDAGAGTAIKIIAQGPGSRHLYSVNGTVRRSPRGEEGGQLLADGPGGLSLRFLLPDDEEKYTPEVTFEVSARAGVPIREARHLARFLTALADASELRLRVEGEDWLVATFQPEEMQRPAASFVTFLDDLVAVEDAFGVSLVFPEEGVTKRDRLWAATLRQIARGAAVPFPGIDGFNFHLSGQYDDQTLRLLRTPKASLLVQEQDFVVELLGEEVHVGHVFIHQLHGTFTDGHAHAAALEAGHGANRPAHVGSKDGLPWMIYLPDRVPADRAVELAGWEAGLPEHPGLEALQALQAQEMPGPDRRRVG